MNENDRATDHPRFSKPFLSVKDLIAYEFGTVGWPAILLGTLVPAYKQYIYRSIRKRIVRKLKAYEAIKPELTDD